MFPVYAKGMAKFKKDDYVAWKWANGMGHGTVKEVRAERTEIESKGKTITRNGTRDNPAIIIKDHNGVTVLKLESEVEKAQ